MAMARLTCCLVLVASWTELAPGLVLSVSFLSLVLVSFKWCPKGRNGSSLKPRVRKKCVSQTHESFEDHIERRASARV